MVADYQSTAAGSDNTIAPKNAHALNEEQHTTTFSDEEEETKSQQL